MIALFENLSAGQADDYSLVLASHNIPCLLAENDGGWKIFVYEEDAEDAWINVEQYAAENPRAVMQDGAPAHQRSPLTFTGIWMSLTLLAWHIAVTSGNDRELFINDYASSASAIIDGELYRSVTSLVLHGNAAHLAGNMAGIAIFGSAVCAIAGWGAGLSMVLMTGILGNIMNAYLYGSNHVSIGASTAVFGAIGILCARQFIREFKTGGRRIRAVIPLCAGLALLGLLGSSQHTDIMAHFFGFISGIAIGTIYGAFMKKPASGVTQAFFLVFTLATLAASWAGGW